jgi:hypothetical protein
MAKITKTPALGLSELADKIGVLGERRRDLGRAGELSVSFSPTGERDIEGNVAAVGDGLSFYAAAGVTQVLVESRARSFADCLRELELYRQVISAA